MNEWNCMPQDPRSSEKEVIIFSIKLAGACTWSVKPAPRQTIALIDSDLCPSGWTYTLSFLQTYALRVNIHFDGCRHKVKQMLQKIEGLSGSSVWPTAWGS